MAALSPADDVHHYVIPQKLLDLIFNKLPVFMCQWGAKKKGCSLSGRSPAPIDSFHVATMVRKDVKLREININNMHTALAS
jgi:hypothetical protein